MIDGAMRTHWSTLGGALAEVEAVRLSDKRSDAHALVDTLADTLAEVEAGTLGNRPGDAHALVDAEADTFATHGAIRTHWSTLWLTRLQNWVR